MLKSIGALALVALWLPASSHAFLQHVGLIHQVHAHDEDAAAGHEDESDGPHEHGADNHAAADGLCRAPSGKVQLDKPVDVVKATWFFATLLNAAVLSCSERSHSGPSPPGTAPPELSHRWQLSSRAALPVRAPSVAS